jgi:soluble lytic murein transglycosylase
MPMPIHRLASCLALLLAGLAAGAAGAEPTAAQRRDFVAALEAARSGPPGRWQELARGLEGYPLTPWLEHHALARDLERADAARVEAFIEREAGTLAGERLRTLWLRRQAAHGHWRRFLAAWAPQDDLALRCRHVEARAATGAVEGLVAEARALWLRGSSLPPDCDSMLGWLRRQGALDAASVWQRIELAARERNHGLIGALAGLLPDTAAAEARRYAALARDPAAQLAAAGAWADTPRARRHVALAVASLARSDHVLAGRRWDGVATRFAFDDADRALAIGAIALRKAAGYEPDAEAWLARLPAEGVEPAVGEWRVREALARRDWPAAAKALATLDAAQQAQPRLRWLRGRMLELDGQPQAALAAWDALADEANFHGFLAADRLGRDYRICAEQPNDDAALAARVAADRGVRRALEWHALDRIAEARREWDFALARLDDAARPVAVALAMRRGWIDRGPLTLLRPAEVRLYELRFPIGHREDIESHARRLGLEPGLVFGLIRAESAWVVDARSAADARGLMQLLPSTARPLARRERVAYAGPNDLHLPPVAIALGTRHLADELARWEGRAWAALAAYNAGPAPVRRWLDARGDLPADLWIETIPFRETRDYVPRVLAFATLYDWRLGHPVVRASTRLGLPVQGAAATAAVACAAPAAARQATATP